MIKRKKTNGAVCYCGPSIHGIVRRFTTYSDGTLPTELELFSAKCPAIKELIVPVGSMADTVYALKDPHSSASVFYKNVENYIKTEGKK